MLLLACSLALGSTKSKYFICHKINHDNIVSLSNIYIYMYILGQIFHSQDVLCDETLVELH
jgi:hypothetical protein